MASQDETYMERICRKTRDIKELLHMVFPMRERRGKRIHMKAVIVIFATLLLSLNSFAGPDKSQQLELLLDVFFHENPMLAMLQQAPMGSLGGFHPVIADEILSEAFRNGTLKNPDLGWFWVGDPRLKDSSTQANFRSRFSQDSRVFYRQDFIIYSREGIRRLLKKPEVVKALHDVGFVATRNVDEAILALKNKLETWEVINRNGAMDSIYDEQMYFREVVYGIFSGFPAQDVLQFAHEDRLHGPAKPDRDFGFKRFSAKPGYINIKHRFFIGGHVTFHDVEHPDVAESHVQVKKGVRAYERARAAGMNNVSIFNQWPALMCASLFGG